MRLNIGCGHRVKDGYYNIDAIHSPKAPRPPELIYSFQFDKDGGLVKQIPLEDGCADEILGVHVFEHFYRWECKAVMVEWHRLLKPGGLLILELPDLIKCCKNIVDGRKGKHPDQLGRWGLYGDPRTMDRLMCHPWGWGPQELIAFLGENGFKKMRHLPTQFHSNGRDHRDMRIEAIKA